VGTTTVQHNGLSPAITPPGATPQRDSTSPQTMEETLEELRSVAARRTGRIPAELLARHVVTITEGGDWPLRRAAMEAIVRRCKFGERDGLVVTCRPAGSVFGSYVTGRTGTPGEPAPGRVERTAAGGVRLEAPPEAAASLVALFEGMARLLGKVSTSPTT
jgi:hypothetical protein